MERTRTVSGLPWLPPRDPESHKGTFGRVLIVAGSRGMAGAAGLAGMGALRCGAGLVTVACPREVAAIVAGYEPSYLTLPLPDDDGRLARGSAEPLLAMPADAVAFGPGLGRSPALADVVASLVASQRAPMVLDADGLNLLVGRLPRLAARPHPTIVTPHPGEFARLLGVETAAVQANRAELAARFARQYGVVVLLKGHHSIITDGERTETNATGNAGMATGGTGDVLTGMIVALLAQGLDPFSAAHLGAYLHGRAGDLAAQQKGQTALIARDLVEFLPCALREYESAAARPADVENPIEPASAES